MTKKVDFRAARKLLNEGNKINVEIEKLTLKLANLIGRRKEIKKMLKKYKM